LQEDDATQRADSEGAVHEHLQHEPNAKKGLELNAEDEPVAPRVLRNPKRVTPEQQAVIDAIAQNSTELASTDQTDGRVLHLKCVSSDVAFDGFPLLCALKALESNWRVEVLVITVRSYLGLCHIELR
jgi:hypothetical protein